MRYRLMASYQGAAYQAGVGPSDEEVTLFAACPPPEQLGFRSSAGHWRKRVSVEEIDALWESRPIGRYRGQRCMVLDDLGDRLHIAYLGQDLYMARRLGYWEVDRGVFEVVVPRQEIEDLREERGEYELAITEETDGDERNSWNSGPQDAWNSPGGRQRNLIDTGPSWAADPGAPYDAGAWEDRDVNAQDPRDTGTWAAVRDLDPRDSPEPGGPYPRSRGGWRATDTGGWRAPDTGSFDAREVMERAAREERDMSDTGGWPAADPAGTGGWDARDMADTGNWPARDLAGTGGWDAPDRPDRTAPNSRDMSSTGGWQARDVNERAARDARDMSGSGGRAAQDVTEYGARDARDLAGTGGWDTPDHASQAGRSGRDMSSTGGWPARDVNERAARDPAGTSGWDAPDRPDRTAPNSRDMSSTGGWQARDVNERAARDARDMSGSGGRAAQDVTEYAARDARDLSGTGGWDAPDRPDRTAPNSRDMSSPGMANTGGWPARDVNERAARDPAGTGGWDARDLASQAGRGGRDVSDSGTWDAREVVAYERRAAAGWDPQDTVVWDPATEWEPGEVVKAPRSRQTPDAAAVWHGSPAPEDADLWGPVPPDVTGAAPRLAVNGSTPPANGAPPLPNGAAPPASDPVPDAYVRDDPLAPPAAPAPAVSPAAPADGPTVPAAGPAAPASPADPREAATPNEYAAMVGRSVGRRAARKARVTTEAIFSQLLELASIPQSAYAVDDEVDGAMCLIRTKGGYEVFSSSDQARHEVRYFEDEEAAYFYLFGILAAEAVRSGHLGPKSPRDQGPRNPPFSDSNNA